MRWTATLFAFVLLVALALVTVSVNVRCTWFSYRIGETMRNADDVTQLIAYRQCQCRQLLRTSELAAWAAQRGWSPEEILRTTWSTPPVSPLAMGAP